MSNIEKLKTFKTPDTRLYENARDACLSILPEIVARIKKLYPSLDTEAMERFDPEFYCPLVDYFIDSVRRLQNDELQNTTQNSFNLNSFLSNDTLVSYGGRDGDTTGSTD